MRKKRKVKVRPSAFLALILAICIVGCIFMYQKYKEDLTPVDTSESITVEIATGTTLNAALEQLEAQGVIRSASSAKIYAKLNGLNDIKAGTYIINPGMSVAEIISYLEGNNALSDEVMITIPEGYWAKQIAELLGEKLSVSADELLAAWNDESYVRELIADYDILSEEIINKDAKVYLEGYLFPETYSFFTETTVDEVTRKLLDHAESVYDSFKDDFAKSSYSVHELMTLASIVQFESGNAEDMKLIASVFYNRLNIGMNLQSSVTVCYARYEYNDWKECEAYANVESPYNTYLNKGLPPSPILNPGKAAIEAVVEPAESDYYYFIGDVYGDGSTIFAKTYEEHLRNIEKYLN